MTPHYQAMEKAQKEALAKDYADAQIAAHTPTVDNETILKDNNGVLHANIATFDTLAAAQAAVQAGEVPDGAIVYVKESGNVDSMGFSIVNGMLCQTYETEV